ncbi:MAG: hypothetical protein IJX76_02370 [Clostridia bacterium]|nr:hypothetical protein [Clostridia bacterium]
MKQNLPLDFVLSFCRDKIPDQGEDSYCYSFCDTAGLLGVFDGCGGAGARKHQHYSDRTEAYMASRLCSGVFFDSFREIFPCQQSAEQLTAEVFAPRVAQRLTEYQPPKDPSGFQIRGSMVRTLPTTAAVALVQQAEDGKYMVSAIWAGDSRVYILDGKGLAQLTVDHTTVSDPMENIYEDGILKNILCSDRKVDLHCCTAEVEGPFMAFSATDGCFGYVSTPMEFEGLLLATLLRAENPAEWETTLADLIGKFAGDDHTLCLGAFGYKTFDALQNSVKERFAYLQETFLEPVGKLPAEDRQSRFALWDIYKNDYFRYMKDGQT